MAPPRLLIAVSAILIAWGALGLLRRLRRSATSPEAFFAQLGEPDGCRALGHAEVCWADGATEADARQLLGTIAAAPPTREVRLRVLRNGSGGGEVVLIAAGAPDAGTAELARLGRRLYGGRPPGALDVFLTNADWKGWQLVHAEPPPGSANQRCCAFPIPSDAPAVKSLPGTPPSPQGGTIAEGSYVLTALRFAGDAPARSSRGALRLGGGELRTAMNWDADWTNAFAAPPECEVYRYRVDGRRLLATKSCPACEGAACDAAFEFTAGEGSLTLFTGGWNEPRVALTFSER